MTRYRSRSYKFPTAEAMVEFVKAHQPKMCVWNCDTRTIRITVILPESLDTAEMVGTDVAILRAGGEPVGDSWEEKSH